jgi:hypothetical protein
MGLGSFFEKNFKNKEVEILVNHDLEWVQYAEAQSISNMIIRATFISYDNDSGVLVFNTGTQEFYVSEQYIQMFWTPGFKLLENVRSMRNTGQKLYNKKDRDIM